MTPITRSKLNRTLVADSGDLGVAVVANCKHGEQLHFNVKKSDDWRGDFVCTDDSGHQYFGSMADMKEWIALSQGAAEEVAA